MSLDDNKHALYQLLAHPKYDNSLNINVYVKFMVFLAQLDLETSLLEFLPTGLSCFLLNRCRTSQK